MKLKFMVASIAAALCLASPVLADIPPTTLSPVINAPVATMPPDGVYIGMSGYSIIDFLFLAFFG